MPASEDGGGLGQQPTRLSIVTDAAWKRVFGEKKRELTRLVEEDALQGTRKSKRLLINAGSFYDSLGEEAPVWPDWGLRFDVLPDSQAEEVDRRRRDRERARQSLVHGPSFVSVLRRGPGRDSGDGGGGDGDESGADRMVAVLEERLREGASAWWQGLVAAETVVDEVAAEFGGEDPLQPAERDALRDARARLEKLIEETSERLGPLELGEPPGELLAALRRHVGLRSGV